MLVHTAGLSPEACGVAAVLGLMENPSEIHLHRFNGTKREISDFFFFPQYLLLGPLGASTAPRSILMMMGHKAVRPEHKTCVP